MPIAPSVTIAQPGPLPAAEVSRAADAAASDNVPIDFGPRPEMPSRGMPVAPDLRAAQPGAPENLCKIPNCPCKVQRGGQICVNTGATIWPPISDDSAYWLAEFLLEMIGQAVAYFRKDKHRVAPTQREIKAFARGLQYLQARRFPFLGAGEDFVLVGGSLFSFTKRAATEEKPKPKPAEIAEAAE